MGTFTVALLAGLIACGGGAATDVKPPEGTPPVDGAVVAPAADHHAAATPPADPAAAPAAAAGPTKATLEEASTSVQPMQPWGVAETALKGKLGEPKVNDAMQATWVVTDAGKCYQLTVTKMMDSVGGAAVTEVPCS